MRKNLLIYLHENIKFFFFFFKNEKYFQIKLYFKIIKLI